MGKKLPIIIVVFLIGGFFIWSQFIKESPVFEGEITFEIAEWFTGQFDGPHLYLLVSTEQIFGHANYEFDHSIITRGNVIKVILGEVYLPDGVSLPAPSPAGFSARLELNEDSDYTLEFHSRHHRDKYIVRTSNGLVEIETVERNFSNTEQTTVKRIPKNMLEAVCFYNGDWKYDPRDDFCERFFNEIEKIAQPYLVAEEGRRSKNQFYLYTGEDQQLIDLLLRHEREDFYIKITTWEGRSYLPPFIHPSARKFPVPKRALRYLEEPVMSIEECAKNDARCITRVAFNTKNAEICRQHLPPEVAWDCLWQVGIAKLDPNLCKYAGDCFTCLEDCYTFIAIQTNTPDLCERMSRIFSYNLNLYFGNLYRNECFYRYAQETGDKSYCHKIDADKPLKIESCLEGRY